MSEAPPAVPDLSRSDMTTEDRVERVLKAKAAFAKRVRQRHAMHKLVEFKVRCGDITITQKGYPYVS